MIRVLFKQAYRNLLKYKLQSFISITGFSLAICFALLIVIITQNRFEYDKSTFVNQNSYRITTNYNDNERFAVSPFGLKEILQRNSSLFNNIGRACVNYDINVKGSKDLIETSVAFIDPELLDIIDFNIIRGNRFDFSDKDPSSIIISNNLNEKLFVDNNFEDIYLQLPRLGEYKVIGVYNNKENKSHLGVDVLIPYSNLDKLNGGYLNNERYKLNLGYNNYTYVSTGTKINEKQISSFLSSLVDKSEFKNILDENVRKMDFHLQGLNEVMFDDLIGDTREVYSQPNYLLLFIFFIAIIVMAIFNFINIGLARALTNTKFIAVHKIFGGNKIVVYLQFISESILHVLIALIFAFCIISIDSFTVSIIGHSIHINNLLVTSFYAVLIIIVIGVISGSLPSFILTRLNYLTLLNNYRSNIVFNKKSISVLLVSFQIVLATIGLMFFNTIYTQSKFLYNSEYGFNSDNIIKINLEPGTMLDDFEMAINSYPEVISTSKTSHMFGSMPNRCKVILENSDDYIWFDYISADTNLLSIFDLKLVSGQNIKIGLNDQETSILLNQTAVKYLGFNNPIGETILINDSITVKIAGVVRDFNYDNFKRSIRPLFIRILPNEYSIINIRVNNNPDDTDIISLIKNEYQPRFPHNIFNYSIYNEEFKERMAHKSDVKKMALIVTIALVVSCLGLIALFMYYIQSQIKPLVVRKIFGANNYRLITFLSGEFVKLIFISCLIGISIGAIFSEIFLQQFAYRIGIDKMTLLVCFIVIVSLNLLIVFSQAIIFVSQNHVKYLT